MRLPLKKIENITLTVITIPVTLSPLRLLFLVRLGDYMVNLCVDWSLFHNPDFETLVDNYHRSVVCVCVVMGGWVGGCFIIRESRMLRYTSERPRDILNGMYSTRFNGRLKSKGDHDQMDTAPGEPSCPLITSLQA
jgi:hypothetical protein